MPLTTTNRYELSNKLNRTVAFKTQLGSLVAKASGLFTTLGGDATEVITVSGVLSTDIVTVTLRVKGGTPRTILTAIPTTDTITVTLSGDPSTDHVLQYVVHSPIA